MNRTGAGGGYRTFLLILLMTMLAASYLERLAMGLFLQDIKTDLELSDTQLGMLTGIAFAFLYSVLGVPIARWADRGNRVVIISLAAAVSGLAVMSCGLAGTFVQLLLLRVCVGIGEAGCVPPAHSLIADFFDRAGRARAVAIYQAGLPLSAVFGYFFGGWLNAWFGWRLTFAILGFPSLALALLAFLTLREPRATRDLAGARGGSADATRDHAPVGVAPPPSLIGACAMLWANRTFRHLLLAYTIGSFFSSGLAQWNPSFFIRSHGFSAQEIGTWFGLIYGVGGLLGTFAGGWLASRYAANDERRQLKVIAALYAVFAVFSPAIYLCDSASLALLITLLLALGVFPVIGPLFATIQMVVPGQMRAMAISLMFLFANLVGLGLGPIAVGALSDGLSARLGPDSLRYALAAFSPGYLWCAWHVVRASKTVSAAIDAVTQADADSAVQTRGNAAALPDALSGTA